MKSSIEPIKDQELFKPLRVTIDLETTDDLILLASLFNQSIPNLRDTQQSLFPNYNFENKADKIYNLWNMVGPIIQELGLANY